MPNTRHRVAGAVTAAILLCSACGGSGSAGSVDAGAQPAAALARPATDAAHRHPATPTVAVRRPLAHVTVGIDPGHNGRNYAHTRYIDHRVWNGREYEACNTTGTETDGGYPEHEFTWRVATDLRRDLRREGARVVLTRHSDHGVGPCVNRRARIINHAHAAVGIDIHADGGPADGRGFAILDPVRDKENRRVVRSSARFGRTLRRAVLAGTPMPTSTYDGHDGINRSRDDLAGLNLTKVPLVLIECGNMRNATDAHLLTGAHFQRRLASAFAAAMTRFVRRSR